MYNISIAQALKKKKRLIHEIQTIQARILSTNSILFSNVFDLDNHQRLTELIFKKQELVALKSAIFLANIPIYEIILQLGEYKSYIQFLRGLDTSTGDQVGGRFGGDIIVTKKAQITQPENESEIKRIEKIIDDLQDKIDEFNAVTKI